jgi:mono/diheme cytochrome c family protein
MDLSMKAAIRRLRFRSKWLAGAILFACPPAHAQAPTADQVDQGRQVYEENCQPCHGRDMVAPGAVVFDLRKFPKDDHERFKNSVLNGKGTGMPAWGDKLSDDEIELLWAYVRGGP